MVSAYASLSIPAQSMDSLRHGGNGMSSRFLVLLTIGVLPQQYVLLAPGIVASFGEQALRICVESADVFLGNGYWCSNGKRSACRYCLSEFVGGSSADFPSRNWAALPPTIYGSRFCSICRMVLVSVSCRVAALSFMLVRNLSSIRLPLCGSCRTAGEGCQCRSLVQVVHRQGSVDFVDLYVPVRSCRKNPAPRSLPQVQQLW